MYKVLLPVLAILGALFGLYIVFWSQRPTLVAPIQFPPAASPYHHAIAGSGIIEASSQNIAVGSPIEEIVAKVFVVEGDEVKIGDPLFQLDLRNFEAQKAAAQAALDEALVTLEDKSKQFSFYRRLTDRRAVSEQIYAQTRYAHLEAETNVKIAQANLAQAETNIQRSIIRAPVNGKILQLNLHVGEIAPVIPQISTQSTWLTVANGALLLIGTVEPLQMRVDIDEEDCWRFEGGARATAFVRGNSHIDFSMNYLRTEP